MRRKEGAHVEQAVETQDVMVAARVPASLRREVKKLALDEGVSIQTIIKDALLRFAQRQGRKK